MTQRKKVSTGPFAVYRLFSAEGELLYIGQSSNPMNRPQALANVFEWPCRVATMKLTWFKSRSEALAAEAAAIKAEKPTFNVQHNMGENARGPRQVVGPVLGEWLEFMGITETQFDALLCVRRGYTRKVVNCEVTPTRKARQIEIATNGHFPWQVWSRGGDIPKFAPRNPRALAIIEAAKASRSTGEVVQ